MQGSKRIFVCGDTHGTHDISKVLWFDASKEGELSKSDFLVVLGDWAGIWGDGFNDEIIELYAESQFTTLIIDGNHDNHDIIHDLPKVNIDHIDKPVGKIADSVYHLTRGEVYQIHDKSIFVMGGGYSIDKEYRVEGDSWWAGEIPSEEEFAYANSNIAEHGHIVDYVLTHSPPNDVIEYLKIYCDVAIPNISLKINIHDGCSVGLDEINSLLSYKKWYFGHLHIDHKFSLLGNEFVATYNDRPMEII